MQLFQLVSSSFSSGFLFIYEVERYALHLESNPPRCKFYPLILYQIMSNLFLGVRTWRGHVDSITGLQYIDQSK
jgi:hypothetical protein